MLNTFVFYSPSKTWGASQYTFLIMHISLKLANTQSLQVGKVLHLDAGSCTLVRVPKTKERFILVAQHYFIYSKQIVVTRAIVGHTMAILLKRE